MTGLKSLIDNNTRGIKWRGLETEQLWAVLICYVGKLIYTKDLGINVNFPYMHQRPTEIFNTIYNILQVTRLHFELDLQRGIKVKTGLRNAN